MSVDGVVVNIPEACEMVREAVRGKEAELLKNHLLDVLESRRKEMEFWQSKVAEVEAQLNCDHVLDDMVSVDDNGEVDGAGFVCQKCKASVGYW